MPARFPMPDVNAVRSLVGDLLGRGVELARATLDGESAPDVVVAVYTTNEGEPGAVVVTDVAGVAVLGAALTSMPTAIVETMKRSGVVDDATIIENFGEVANVLGQVLNTVDTPHLRYAHVATVDQLDDAVRAVLEQPAGRRDLAVTVEGYGNGRFSFAIA